MKNIQKTFKGTFMKRNKRKLKGFSLLLTFVMIFGLICSNLSAYAESGEEHVHTEECYAKAGDLLCTAEESDGHTHGENCYCKGGEYTCGQTESEGHTHTDSCYEISEDGAEKNLICEQEESEGHIHSEDCICSGGEIICGLEESSGHTHNEDCYAKGGELICGQEEVVSSSTEQGYNYIKALLLNDDSISFAPDTQTFLVIDVDAVQSEHLASLNVYQAEERIKEYELTFDVSINGTPIANGQTYYLASQADNTIETITVSDSFKMAANSGKVAVFILNKEDTYAVSYDIEDCYYTKKSWADGNGNSYNGDSFTCRPTSNEIVTKYDGTAEDDPVVAPFSFEWDLSNYFDIEIWMGDAINKQMENPGWVFPDGTTGYVDFLIELRDADGNISLLPRTYFNNYGNDDLFGIMQKDGVVSIPLSHYDDDAEDGSPYGEFDIYIPFGYDYRITLLSYSVDTLGGYAYYYNQEHTPDADDFCITDKSITGQGEWGSFFEFTFMPMNKEIRIEKTVEGNEPQNAEYEFQVTELVPSFANKYNDEGKWDGYKKTDDLYQQLSDYPYELYDAKTHDKIDTISLKTDENGCFSMKSDQYAVFKTWELPEDFDEYDDDNGFDVKDIYDAFSKDISMESRYIVNEVENPDCSTKITHIHNDTETQIQGKKIENVYGGDSIIYKNIFSSMPVGNTGSLIVSKTVAGNAGSTTKEFSFTVKLDDSSINGTYGDMTFENGVATFTLKHNEKKTASGIPEGTAYEVTEEDANKNGYTTTSSGASGTILKDKTVEAAFTNTKSNGGSNGGGSGKKYGALTVSKTVTGNAGDTTKAFSFTVKLDSSLSGTYGDMTFENGVAEFTLKHGESKTATKLPAGTHYTVTESDNDGYSVTAEGDTGNITKNKTAVAAFINHKDEEPDTPPNVPTNPDNPNVPTDPNQPNVPTNPDQPTTNIITNQPNQPDTPEHYDNTPKTGDTMNLTLWFTVLGISLVGILYCIFRRVLRR